MQKELLRYLKFLMRGFWVCLTSEFIWKEICGAVFDDECKNSQEDSKSES